MIMFFILLTQLIWAQTPEHWNQSIRIVEKHEFYKNNEVILKPKDSWQTLFGILYRDENLGEMKDCVFYFVPGVDPGVLKIKKTSPDVPCDELIFQDSDRQWTNLKSIQFSFEYNVLTLFLTLQDYSIEKWQVSLLSTYQNPVPKLFMSSAEYRSGSMIVFGQGSKYLFQLLKMKKTLKNGDICHVVNESCEVKGSSTCSMCEAGWFEIPNGCKVSPKFCGIHNCGTKNRPACRRGMTYQKQKIDFNCRGDQSFVYCRKGLKVQCQGQLAYCI